MKNYFYIPVLLLAGLTTLNGCTPPASHTCSNEYSPVFSAASSGNLSVVKKAVKDDLDLATHTDCNKLTLLHNATASNHTEMAKFLLSQGADAEAVTKDNVTPLHMAAQNDNVEIIKMLLAYGAKVNAMDLNGLTPLDVAEKMDRTKAVEYLKKHGGHAGKNYSQK